MRLRPAFLPCMASAGILILLAGCTTTHREVRQFEPLPRPPVGSQELAPVKPRSVTELLRAAQEAFEAGNAAQEKGDRDAALKSYTKMLEFLAEANLDPAIFYNLRSEFKSILDHTEKQASRLEREHKQWRPEDITAGVVQGLEIEFPLSDRILEEIEEIRTGYPKGFQAGLDRSYKYLPQIKAEFAGAKLPEDLVWLAMVESQFCPKDVSRSGAAGMWQFMKETGLRYNLHVDRYVDDRFNWEKATRAAIQYLTELHEEFGGSWPLAVSAYNMGEGGLERAIAAIGGERNLWKLIETPPASEYVKQETKKYYARLLATIIVAKDPERFGFTPNPQPPEETARVPVRGSYSLAALERAGRLREGTLRELNPDLIRGVTPPSGEFQLAVPPQASAQLASAIGALPQIRPDMMRRTHIVRRGETVEVIANKYRIATDDLVKTNKLRASARLTVGKRLTIPGDADFIDDTRPSERPANKPEIQAAKAQHEPSRPGKNAGRIYTVKQGDTLSNIAKTEHISIEELKAWNKLKKEIVHAGDKLKLAPMDDLDSGEFREPAKTHVVKPGEFPEKIAKLYGVGVDDLLDWNNLSKDAVIIEGEKLVIRRGKKDKEPAPADPKGEKPDSKGAKENTKVAKANPQGEKTPSKEAKANPNPPKADAKTTKANPAPAKSGDPEKVIYVVAKGETPSTIAEKYKVKMSDFYQWNGWKKDPILQIGQKVTILKPK